MFEANTIINRSPSIAFLWKNEEGWPVEFVSSNVESLIGYTVDDFVENKVSYAEIIHKDDIERVAAEVSTNIKNPIAKLYTSAVQDHNKRRFCQMDGG